MHQNDAVRDLMLLVEGILQVEKCKESSRWRCALPALPRCWLVEIVHIILRTGKHQHFVYSEHLADVSGMSGALGVSRDDDVAPDGLIVIQKFVPSSIWIVLHEVGQHRPKPVEDGVGGIGLNVWSDRGSGHDRLAIAAKG